MLLAILLWFALGVFSGLTFAYIFYKNSNQIVPLLILGIIGALIGGSFGQIMTAKENFNPATALVSIIGALVLITLYRNISPQN